MSSFPPKTPDEEKLLTFDFTSEAALGSTISNPLVEYEVVSEGEEVDDGLTLGTPSILGMYVRVLCGDGTDGYKYRIICTVDADNGEHHRIDKDLPVKETAALV